MNSEHDEKKTDVAVDFDPAERRFWHGEHVEEALAVYDLECVVAHVRMLGETGIVDKAIAKSILEALTQIKQELSAGKSYLKSSDADIHTALERRLHELVGEQAAAAQLAKSRHDQIATVTRLWLREQLDDIFAALLDLRIQLIGLAQRDLDVLMPGYTHMQPVQPILISHWWLANEARFRRDYERLLEFRRRLNVLPLGAHDLAGTQEPLDRQMVAQYLKFDGVMENSLDAVSDRDYVVEFACFASLVGTHLAQMSADLQLWSTQEFGFVKLQRRFIVRTQKLPYKKNRELLEVLRARPAVFVGRLIEFVTILKALPSGYSQDLQECLPGLLEIVQTLKFVLELSLGLLGGIDLDAKRMREVACADLMNWSNAFGYLTQHGVQEEHAQKVVEHLAHYCKTRKKFLSDLALSEWQQFSPVFEVDVYDHVTTEESVGAFCSFGGSSKDEVELSISRAREALPPDSKGRHSLTKETVVSHSHYN